MKTEKQPGNNEPHDQPAPTVVPIGDLVSDPGNLRRHDERGRSGIESSLKRFGPARSIVVDGNGVVRAGNGTLEAARKAGITDVLVVEPKPGQLVAVRRSDWSPSEATGYGIADNRLTDMSSFDPDALSATLRALQSEDFDLDAVGFTDAEVDAMFGSDEAGKLVDDPQAEWQGMPECENGDLTPFRSINVHFKSPDDVRQFAELIQQKITENAKFLWYPRSESVDWTGNPYVNEP